MPTLYETLGNKLPAYGTPERNAMATAAGIQGYTGTAAQNAAIVANLNKPSTPPPSPNNTMVSAGLVVPKKNQNDIDMENALAARIAAASDTGLPTANERQYATQMFQAQIDALNKVYAEQKAKSMEMGRSRLGSQNAIQARRGLLGSDFGEAATVGQEQANTAELNAIDAEQMAQIAAVQGKISQSALDMAKARREAATQGADKNLETIKYTRQKAVDDVKSAVSAYLAGGGDIKNLTPKMIDDFANEMKISRDTVVNIIKEEQTTAANNAAAKAKAALETQKTTAEINKTKAETYKLLNPSTTLSGNKLTLSEVQKQGLPLSLVGKSEIDIANQLDSSTPPVWFIEKAEKESRQTLDSKYASDLWNKYRNNIVNHSDNEVTNKAKDYFSRQYGTSVTPEDISALSDRVKTYVLGGMSYMKAIQAVEDEAQQ